MLRLIIQIFVPIISLFIVYILWRYYSKGGSKKKSLEFKKFSEGQIFFSILIFFILTISSFIYLAAVNGVSPDAGKYQSPRLENGIVVGPTYGD